MKMLELNNLVIQEARPLPVIILADDSVRKVIILIQVPTYHEVQKAYNLS